MIDFDEPGFYETWLERAGDRTKGLVVQKTGKGIHVLFRCPEPGINQKLAFVKDELYQQILESTDGLRLWEFEKDKLVSAKKISFTILNSK